MRRGGRPGDDEVVPAPDRNEETQLVGLPDVGEGESSDETQLFETLPSEPSPLPADASVSWVGTGGPTEDLTEQERAEEEVALDPGADLGDGLLDEEDEADYDVLSPRGYGTDEPDDFSEHPEPMRQMVFVDVSLVLPATHPVVVLQEAEAPYRELRIPVGGAEGLAIAYAARKVATPRPLTHEMVSQLLDTCDITLDSIRLTSMNGSNFHAELVLSGRGGVRTLDCRPSDAIALALRRALPVPIMAAVHVLELAGEVSPSAN